MRFRASHAVVLLIGALIGCSLMLLAQRDTQTTSDSRRGDHASNERQASSAAAVEGNGAGNLVHREVLGQAREVMADDMRKEDPVQKVYQVCPFQQLSPPHHPDKRYTKLSHEARARDLLYTGVITYDMVFFEHCRALTETWGAAAEGHLDCFATAKADRRFHGELDLPVIGLRDFVHEERLFKTLQYMWENLLTQYDFFLIVPDRSTYVKIEQLRKVLQHVNPLQPLYMGYSRFANFKGKAVRYCFLELGIVLSRSALAKLAGSLTECLQVLKQGTLGLQSDEILGGCLAEYVGVQCTWSDEVRDMFYFDFNDLLGTEELYSLPAVRTAVSIAPLKTILQLYRLHQYMLELEIVEYRQHLHRTRREFIATNKHIPHDTRYKAPKWSWLKLSSVNSRKELIVWNYLNATHFCREGTEQPMSLLAKYQKTALQKVMEYVLWEINSEGGEGLRYMKEHTVYDGFVLHDPLMGDEYVLRVIMTKPTDEQEQIYVNVVVPLEEPGALIWHPWGDPWEGVKVDMVVPITWRDTATCLAFLDNFKSEVIEKGLPVALHFVLSKNVETSLVLRIQQRIDDILDIHPSTRVTLHKANITDFSYSEVFKFGAGLLHVDRLLIFMSIHFMFFHEFLTHALTLAIRGEQVYLPVPFQFYQTSLQPSNSSHLVSWDMGFWDTQNFDVIAMYVQDYEALGHLGPEDGVIDKLLTEAALSKVRGLDPYLRVSYEGNPLCRPDSNEAGLVQDTNLESEWEQGGCSLPLGSRQVLSDLVQKHKLAP